MQQTELYAADQGSTVTGKKRGKSPGAAKASGGARSRMKESVEDAAMLKAGQNEDQYSSQKIEKQPKLISKKKGTMRPYQVEGLNWIMQLHDRGVSGILADEMGLGKTLQSISVIAYLREARGIKGKHIVIVPKSVLDNRMREFRVWCPVVRTLRFHGTKAERKVIRRERLDPGDFDVVITTYEMLIREKSGFLKHAWHYIIIDEAHRIKNDKSVLSQTVRAARVARRFCPPPAARSPGAHSSHAPPRAAPRTTTTKCNDDDKWIAGRRGLGAWKRASQAASTLRDDTNLGERSI